MKTKLWWGRCTCGEIGCMNVLAYNGAFVQDTLELADDKNQHGNASRVISAYSKNDRRT